MNKYLRAGICLPIWVTKKCITKLMHWREFSAPWIALVSPLSEITLEKDSYLRLGRGFKMRDGAKIRVRTDASCIIGEGTSVNSNNMIVCREKIVIGKGCQFAPNVLIYDHDHDFRAPGGISAMKYKTSPVIIGDNVWIGANTVILRGTKIGDNCVIAAGSVIKGEYPSDTVIIQKRNEEYRKLGK